MVTVATLIEQQELIKQMDEHFRTVTLEIEKQVQEVEIEVLKLQNGSKDNMSKTSVISAPKTPKIGNK